jgi:hypothetical protein
MSIIPKLFTLLALILPAPNLYSAGKATHVVVVVWDGRRPGFVTLQYSQVSGVLYFDKGNGEQAWSKDASGN